jgi:hypothetical protein
LTQLNALNTFYHIKELLPKSVINSFTNSNKSTIYHCLTLNGINNIYIIKYLLRYPLYSIKSIDLKRFMKIFNRLTDDRDHTTRRAHLKLSNLLNKLIKK